MIDNESPQILLPFGLTLMTLSLHLCLPILKNQLCTVKADIYIIGFLISSFKCDGVLKKNQIVS